MRLIGLYKSTILEVFEPPKPPAKIGFPELTVKPKSSIEGDDLDDEYLPKEVVLSLMGQYEIIGSRIAELKRERRKMGRVVGKGFHDSIINIDENIEKLEERRKSIAEDAVSELGKGVSFMDFNDEEQKVLKRMMVTAGAAEPGKFFRKAKDSDEPPTTLYKYS